MAVWECYVSVGRMQTFLELAEIPISFSSEKENLSLWTGTQATLVNQSWLFQTSLVIGINRSLSHLQTRLRLRGAHEIPQKAISRHIDMLLHYQNINQEFHRGELYCIIGSVGSRKLPLLQALACELPSAKGCIIHRYFSFAQEPWLMCGTPRRPSQWDFLLDVNGIAKLWTIIIIRQVVSKSCFGLQLSLLLIDTVIDFDLIFWFSAMTKYWNSDHSKCYSRRRRDILWRCFPRVTR